MAPGASEKPHSSHGLPLEDLWGAFLGMHLFHHKTRHKKFRLLVPLFMVIHLSLIAWLAVNA